MNKILLVLASLSFSVQTFANPCGEKSIDVGDKKVKLVQVQDNEMVAGIYKFVRKGQVWNIYRCADDIKKDKNGTPLLNLDKCVIKNDWAFGNLVSKFGTSGITVRKTSDTQLEVKLNVADTESLDYYDVKATEKGLELLENQYKYNKVQPSQSRHEKVSLGVCDSSAPAPTSKKSSGSPAKKVGITN